MRSWHLLLVACCACGPRPLPTPEATADQTVAEAMRLVCEAPLRADRDRGEGTRADKIAGHLTDGVGNVRVLTLVEGWKTDGIRRSELDPLVNEARIASCPLQREAD